MISPLRRDSSDVYADSGRKYSSSASKSSINHTSTTTATTTACFALMFMFFVMFICKLKLITTAASCFCHVFL